ncbi:MAG: methyltransferase domain-containing protein [Bacteroidetes bacterium]|nr:MAG: methyltransferase domain-containing protein [Bacteroidota bacterium]
MQRILLPGGDKQLEWFSQSVNLEGKSILVCGANLAPAVEELISFKPGRIEFILPDYESLMNANLYFSEKNIIPKMMDFEVTDFENDEFDFIYAQASVSGFNRKKIIKEFKRILKPSGIICVGEIILKHPEYPQFIEEILDNSDIEALTVEELKNFYTSRKFEVVKEADLSSTLKEFYLQVRKHSEEVKEDLTESEKSYYKKILKKASHEANAFLEFGADKFIGYQTLILKMGD